MSICPFWGDLNIQSILVALGSFLYFSESQFPQLCFGWFGLLSQNTVNWIWLHNRNLFHIVLEAGKFRILVPLWLSSNEGLFLVFWWHLAISSDGREWNYFSYVSSYKYTNCTPVGSTLMSGFPPKGLRSQYHHTKDKGFNICIWLKHKHSVHSNL